MVQIDLNETEIKILVSKTKPPPVRHVSTNLGSYYYDSCTAEIVCEDGTRIDWPNPTMTSTVWSMDWT